MFKAQNRDTKLVFEKLLCPPRDHFNDERDKIVLHNTTQNLQDQDQDQSVKDQDQDRFFDLRPVSDHITGLGERCELPSGVRAEP